MKALEKDRVRRYGTASELAADISRYLRQRAGSSGSCNRWLSRAKVRAPASSCLGRSCRAWCCCWPDLWSRRPSQLHRTTIERDRANRERDRATRITDFMTKMFKVSDPSEARGNTITAREILDKASRDINSGLTKDPELQAQMMHVMGDVYDNLGLYSRAESLEQQAWRYASVFSGRSTLTHWLRWSA